MMICWFLETLVLENSIYIFKTVKPKPIDHGSYVSGKPGKVSNSNMVRENLENVEKSRIFSKLQPKNTILYVIIAPCHKPFSF